MMGVMPGLVFVPIPLFVFGAIAFLLRWWPLRRLRRLAERDAASGGTASRIKVTFGGTAVSAADYVALYRPGGIVSAPPELALNRFNRWASTTVQWSDDDPVIRFFGTPPKWLCNGLVAEAPNAKEVRV